MKRGPRPVPLAMRVWSKIEVRLKSQCWPIRKACPNGYGRVKDGGRYKGLHVAAFEQVHGPLPKGKIVCHTCDHTWCGNPWHMYAGTKSSNARDWWRSRKGKKV